MWCRPTTTASTRPSTITPRSCTSSQSPRNRWPPPTLPSCHRMPSLQTWTLHTICATPPTDVKAEGLCCCEKPLGMYSGRCAGGKAAGQPGGRTAAAGRAVAGPAAAVAARCDAGATPCACWATSTASWTRPRKCSAWRRPRQGAIPIIIVTNFGHKQLLTSRQVESDKKHCGTFNLW